MHNLKPLLTFLVLSCMGMVGSVFASDAEWPLSLAIPERAEPLDSNGVRVGTSQNLFLKQFKSKDSVRILVNTPSYGLAQSVIYEMHDDYTSNIRDQYVDLSGEIIKKKLPLGLGVGLEWLPVFILKRHNLTRSLDAAIEAGPVVRFSSFGIPVQIHAGGAGRLSNDSLLGGLSWQKYTDLRPSHGVYAGAEIGDPSDAVAGLPLYFNLKGYGRSLGATSLVSAIGSVLWCQGLNTGDTVLAMYTDSLINGKDIYLGQSNGKPGFITSPQKLERSYQFTGGIKAAPRLYLEPRIVYSFTRHSNEYPSQPQLLSNRTTTTNSIHVLASSVAAFPVSYSGGFRVDFGQYDNNFDRTLFASTNEESLKVVMDIHSAYQVSMFHRLGKYLTNGMGVEYSYTISRLSTMYPQVFVSNFSNNSDKDIIVSQHRISVVPMPVKLGNSTLFYEYSQNLTNNIIKEMSGQNTMDWHYRIGTTYRNTVFALCTLSEVMSTDANVRRYAFPAFNKGNFPEYSRKWNSFLTASTALTNKLNLLVSWSESYTEHGAWVGNEYLDSTQVSLLKDFKDYYAIDNKNWIHGIRAGLSMAFMRDFQITGGCAFQFNDDRAYDATTHSYASAILLGQKRTTPFCLVQYDYKTLVRLKANVSYNIEDLLKYWDVSVSLTGAF